MQVCDAADEIGNEHINSSKNSNKQKSSNNDHSSRWGSRYLVNHKSLRNQFFYLKQKKTGALIQLGFSGEK
jgi:hypothetical protein